MMVSFAIQKPFSFLRSHLLIDALSAFAVSALSERLSLGHILLCQIQGIWPEAEVFDPFGVKFG